VKLMARGYKTCSCDGRGRKRALGGIFMWNLALGIYQCCYVSTGKIQKNSRLAVRSMLRTTNCFHLLSPFMHFPTTITSRTAPSPRVCRILVPSRLGFTDSRGIFGACRYDKSVPGGITVGKYVTIKLKREITSENSF
jgi:hypothetical protein